MAAPFKAAKSGSGIAIAVPGDSATGAVPTPGAFDSRLQAPSAPQIIAIVGVADTAAALDVTLYLSQSSSSVAGASPLAHLRTAAGQTAQVSFNPIGVTITGGAEYLLANFADTGVGHEVWIYLE